jgi:hypothetical protein
MKYKAPHGYSFVRRSIAFAAVLSLFAVTSAFAQTAPKNYEVELVVAEGKKSVETDAVLSVKEDGFRVEPDKQSFKSSAKEFSFKDVKTADYSFAKKPMLSGGGAVATAILLGVFVLPFLFMKKKKHWMTVQTEKEFAVIKLGDNNHRQIVAEFETHGVKVNTVTEDKKKGE